MTKNIETQIAEATFDAFTAIMGGVSYEEQIELFGGIETVDIDGQPVARVLLGVLVAVSGLQESLTGERLTLPETARMMVVLADTFQQAHDNDSKGGA